MKRNFLSLLLCPLLAAGPACVYALGLGNLELESGLNQPFAARIELLSATVEELQSLNIALADRKVFERAGIDRSFVLSTLKFEVDDSGAGPAYIRITSPEAIREPFLNFLLEASWSKGRLYREYTVLLDPPLYDPYARRPQPVETMAPGLADEFGDSPEIDTPEDAAGEDLFDIQTADDYGPTVSSDTLWSIASRLRPDASVSIQQMMLALLRANPEAFLDNNINGLKRGQILRMPSPGEIDLYSQAEALAETKSQYRLWQEARGAIAAVAPTRVASRAVADSDGNMDEGLDELLDDGLEDGLDTTFAEAEDSAELKLVAALDEGNAAGQSDSDGAGSGESAALVNEQLQALSQENVELRERMAEADAIIEDLQRLITLKDDELAAMQQQLSGAIPPEELDLAEDELVDELGMEATAETPTDAAPGWDEQATDIVEAQEDTSAVAADEAEDPVAAEAAEEAVAAAEEPPPAGLLDQAIAFVTANLIMVAGALGGLILIVGAAVLVKQRVVPFIERKRSERAEAAAVAARAAALSSVGDAAAETTTPDAAEADEDVATEDADAAAAESEPEEDPLAEVNVFLAYEHFDQAEEFVRDAIAGAPQKLDFHAKLLEVFYAAGNKQGYEEEARVLHGLVAGAGPYWESALAMWAELSPNRALFAEPVAGEEDDMTDPGAGGIVDLTADEAGPAAEADAGLDFDLGLGDAEPASEDDVTDPGALAIPGGAEDVLDMTASMETSADQGEDLLDVTAAVGLDMDAELEQAVADSDAEEAMLDITGGGADEDMLDITGGVGASEDMLDITGGGAAEDALLDVAAATSAAAEDDNALDFDIGGLEPEAAAPESPAEGDADNVIDFDLALNDEAEAAAPDSGGLDLDLGGDEAPELDMEAGADAGLEADLSADADSLEMDIAVPASEGDGISLDMDAAADGGLELDIGAAGDDDLALDMGVDADAELGLGTDDSEVVDIGIGDDAVPEIELDMGAADEDDDDRTVLVPRSAGVDEQSADDEVATKLDLAKAYVELGDKDSAKSILDEVIADGNDTQKQQAQELLDQV